METEVKRKDTAQTLQTRTVVQASPVAFGLSIAGLVIQALVAVFFVAVISLATWAYNVLPSSLTADWTVNVNLSGFAIYLAYTIPVLAVGFLGALWLRSNDSNKIKAGAAIVLVASLISVTTVWGFFIGSLLSIIGAILGFTTIQRITGPGWRPTLLTNTDLDPPSSLTKQERATVR